MGYVNSLLFFQIHPHERLHEPLLCRYMLRKLDTCFALLLIENTHPMSRHILILHVELVSLVRHKSRDREFRGVTVRRVFHELLPFFHDFNFA